MPPLESREGFTPPPKVECKSEVEKQLEARRIAIRKRMEHLLQYAPPDRVGILTYRSSEAMYIDAEGTGVIHAWVEAKNLSALPTMKLKTRLFTQTEAGFKVKDNPKSDEHLSLKANGDYAFLRHPDLTTEQESQFLTSVEHTLDHIEHAQFGWRIPAEAIVASDAATH